MDADWDGVWHTGLTIITISIHVKDTITPPNVLFIVLVIEATLQLGAQSRKQGFVVTYFFNHSYSLVYLDVLRRKARYLYLHITHITSRVSIVMPRTLQARLSCFFVCWSGVIVCNCRPLGLHCQSRAGHLRTSAATTAAALIVISLFWITFQIHRRQTADNTRTEITIFTFAPTYCIDNELNY